MITPEYCQQMARYNSWQNQQLIASLGAMSDVDVRKDRGAFFGSIFATANHLLWGDMLWITRFDGGEGPSMATIPGGLDMAKDVEEWAVLRAELDGRIERWARGVESADLVGNLEWHSTAMQRDFSKPKAVCVIQLFNHQTHHRGQIHAMLGAAGAAMPVTDVPFMPEG